MKITIDHIKENGWLIFEAIVGSKAYGLNTESSDTDIRGVFILPKELYYGLEYIPQVNNETNDIVYYELKRFIELLANNNPNMLELLALPQECILIKHQIFNKLSLDFFLSKQSEKSYANYAFTQIKKASGLEKKIMNPMDLIKKTVIDFCFVIVNNKEISLNDYLLNCKIIQNSCGLTKITHFKDCYFLYHSENSEYYGIISDDKANEVCFSSIEVNEIPKAILYFNKDAYSVYCKQYREYFDWVNKRNEDRYNTTITHGKKYDAKNMMHVFRLLNMATEIAKEGTLNVFRKDREFLLAIKSGQFEYDDLLEKANAIHLSLSSQFQNSSLKDNVNKKELDKILVEMRETFYILKIKK